MITTTNSVGQKVTIAKTEFIKQTLNPEWKPFAISVNDVLGGINGTKSHHYTLIHYLLGKVTVACYDWDADGGNDLIGSFECPLEELLYSDTVYPLVNPNKKRYYSLF